MTNISVLHRLSNMIAALRARGPANIDVVSEPFDPDAIETNPDAHVGSI